MSVADINTRAMAQQERCVMVLPIHLLMLSLVICSYHISYDDCSTRRPKHHRYFNSLRRKYHSLKRASTIDARHRDTSITQLNNTLNTLFGLLSRGSSSAAGVPFFPFIPPSVAEERVVHSLLHTLPIILGILYEVREKELYVSKLSFKRKVSESEALVEERVYSLALLLNTLCRDMAEYKRTCDTAIGDVIDIVIHVFVSYGICNKEYRRPIFRSSDEWEEEVFVYLEYVADVLLDVYTRRARMDGVLVLDIRKRVLDKVMGSKKDGILKQILRVFESSRNERDRLMKRVRACRKERLGEIASDNKVIRRYVGLGLVYSTVRSIDFYNWYEIKKKREEVVGLVNDGYEKYCVARKRISGGIYRTVGRRGFSEVKMVGVLNSLGIAENVGVLCKRKEKGGEREGRERTGLRGEVLVMLRGRLREVG